jgi:hypothetical protein
MKRAIDIEKLLIWAYAEELPKREHRQLLGVSNYELVSNYAQEMCETVSDGRSLGNRYWQLYGDGPHPDALLVEAAVKGLDGFTPVLHEDPEVFFSDMPEEVKAEAEAALARYHVEIVPLVIRCASMGRRPDWRTEIPVQVPWKPEGSSGHPPYFQTVEVKGPFGKTFTEEQRVLRDPKTRRPPPGAYHKMVWQPEPWAAIDGRVDWLVWLAALSMLSESLAGTLKDYEPTPPMIFQLPWECGREDAQESPRVLMAVSMERLERLEAEPRGRMLGRARAVKAGAVRHTVKDGVAIRA